MDGFVDRLHALRFLRACDPSYGALTFTLVGLPPTGYISLLLDILFGSFLPSLWSSSNHSLLGLREPTLLCNQVSLRLQDLQSAVACCFHIGSEFAWINARERRRRSWR